MTNRCETCGEEHECSRCRGAMTHFHFTTGEPPAWFHNNCYVPRSSDPNEDKHTRSMRLAQEHGGQIATSDRTSSLQNRSDSGTDVQREEER